MYMYSLKNCLDGRFCPEEILLHAEEFTEEEFFKQVVDSVNQLREEPFECAHEIRNLFRNLLEKGRPVDFEHVIQKMCDTYGYQTITAKKHSYALWQKETKIIKSVGKHHTSHYRDVDEDYLQKRFIGSAGNGGFWSDK